MTHHQPYFPGFPDSAPGAPSAGQLPAVSRAGWEVLNPQRNTTSPLTAAGPAQAQVTHVTRLSLPLPTELCKSYRPTASLNVLFWPKMWPCTSTSRLLNLLSTEKPNSVLPRGLMAFRQTGLLLSFELPTRSDILLVQHGDYR